MVKRVVSERRTKWLLKWELRIEYRLEDYCWWQFHAVGMALDLGKFVVERTICERHVEDPCRLDVCHQEDLGQFRVARRRKRW